MLSDTTDTTANSYGVVVDLASDMSSGGIFSAGGFFNYTAGTRTASIGIFGLQGAVQSAIIPNAFADFTFEGLRYTVTNDANVDGGENYPAYRIKGLNVQAQMGAAGKTIEGNLFPLQLYGAEIRAILVGTFDATNLGVADEYGDAYGMYLELENSSIETDGDIHCYTLYLKSAASAVGAGNNWALYSVDDVPSYLAGDLEIGGDANISGTLEVGGTTTVGDVVRGATTLYRRYYHLSVGGFDPGASGATWVDPSADTTGGWQLNTSAEKLIAGTDVHADWDGASDIMVTMRFALNDTAGGDPNVDLQLIAYYGGIGDTSTKTQTVEVVTDTDGTQYKVYSVEFTLDYDATNNVIDVGDHITFILNLETDTSEIDDIIITEGTFYYNTTHIGIESGDI